jgi:hypothetical protein
VDYAAGDAKIAVGALTTWGRNVHGPLALCLVTVAGGSTTALQKIDDIRQRNYLDGPRILDRDLVGRAADPG